MSNQIFREKSLERINTPQELKDYVKVAKPSMWLLIAAIILLLIGVIVWGAFGKLDTVVKTFGIVENNEMKVYIKEADYASLDEDDSVIIDGIEYEIDNIFTNPICIMPNGHFNDYMLHLGDMISGEWVYEFTVNNVQKDNGTYEVNVVLESVKPLSFVLN